MIIDLKRFIQKEERYWKELELILDQSEQDLLKSFTLAEIRRFHYLVSRASSGLNRIQTFSSESESRSYLESIVSRAHSQLHATENRLSTWNFREWFFVQIPQVFRKRIRYFLLSLIMTLTGAAIGAGLISQDSRSREVIFPFAHLLSSPLERVQEEESRTNEHPVDQKRGQFAGQLMTHNIQVSLLVLGMGMLWGIGSFILLFYNGVILGAVCYDYLHHGLGVFLAGWLLPHGVIEIPAILVAGQAGLLLAHAVIGNDQGLPFRSRIAEVQYDVLHLSGLLALMLIWAGLVEAFFSQYHEPRLPYSLKIGFGVIEAIVLLCYWRFAGKKGRK